MDTSGKQCNNNISNPSLDYYLFQLCQYAVIVYLGARIVLLDNDDVFNVKFGTFLLVVYCFSCFWTKRMLLYGEEIEVVYPTRFICRKCVFAHDMIQKVVFTDKGRDGKRFVIYKKCSRRHHTIKSGTITDIKMTIRYFCIKNVILEFDLINPSDKEKYTDVLSNCYKVRPNNMWVSREYLNNMSQGGR